MSVASGNPGQDRPWGGAVSRCVPWEGERTTSSQPATSSEPMFWSGHWAKRGPHGLSHGLGTRGPLHSW